MSAISCDRPRAKWMVSLVWTVILSSMLSVGFLFYNAAVVFAERDVDLFRYFAECLGKYWIGLFIPLLVIVGGFFFFPDRSTRFFFRYRYFIAFAILFLCVAFSITGSSIGLFCKYFAYPDEDVVFGVSRHIRSDEWAVYTPMAWAQYLDPNGKFSYFSSLLRAGDTDVFLVYGQPVRNLIVIFRPFQIGYLFLPMEKGASFFWCGRFLALFLASFEFGRLILNDNRRLSLAFSFCIVFAPVVQWWFVINGLVEIIITIEVSILALDRFLRDQRFWMRAGMTLLIAECAGCYILTFYPPWQIPFGYILAALIIWVLIRNKGNMIFRIQDLIIVLCGILILICSMAYVFVRSFDTIKAIMGTVYPGQRLLNGGGDGRRLFASFANLWYALTGRAAYNDVCNSALIMDFFPVCYILPGLLAFKGIRSKEKMDILTALLFIPSVLLTIWAVFGLPAVAAKLTLLNRSQPTRTLVAIGFCNLLILFRAIGRITKTCRFRTAGIVVSIATAVLVHRVISWLNPDFFSTGQFIISICLWIVLVNCLFNMNHDAVQKVFVIMLGVVMFITGVLVNPIRTGMGSVKDIPEIRMVKDVVANDPMAVWIVEGKGLPVCNSTILAGARTINTTNVYPNLSRWRSIDKDGKYENIYNRYAHITIEIADKDPEGNRFEIGIGQDTFTVRLTTDDLYTLGVDYIFTQRKIEGAEFEQLAITGTGYRVYKLIR